MSNAAEKDERQTIDIAVLIAKLIKMQTLFKQLKECNGMDFEIVDLSLEDSKKITKEDLKCLSQYEITPSDEYKTGKSRRLSPKNCYQKAFEYVSSKSHIEGIKLAHGLYKPSFFDNHCGHAWAELPNGIIFDGVLQRFYNKEGYYNFYQIVKQKEYDHKEMYRIGREHGGHYGPW